MALLRDGCAPHGIPEVRLDAQRKILVIADGLALDQGDVPLKIMQLCVFILDQMRSVIH